LRQAGRVGQLTLCQGLSNAGLFDAGGEVHDRKVS
jgi:hypothetical protein